MKNYRLRTVATALSCVFVLSACTANDGVATETTPATDAYGVSAYSQQTLDLSGESVETIYGSQLPQYLNHQYFFEGQPVSMTESNFYFIDTFSELTQYAGYYYPITAEGFVDLSATIDTASETEEMQQYNTYADFFISYSEQMLESACIINKLAADEGLTLPAETVDEINEIMDNLRSTGADAAGLTMDEYLSIYYGEGTTEDSFRQVVYNYYLADLYTQHWIENYEFDPAEITVPNIRYTLYQVTPGASEEERAAAEEAATALFEEAEGDVEVFTVQAALAYTNGDTADYGEIGVPNDGSIDAVFTEWAWDESRQENDLDLIYSEDFGYFVVAYIGETEISEAAQEQLAVKKFSEVISEAIENEEYEFYCADAFAAAPTVAPTEATLPVDIANAQDPALAQTPSTVGNLTGSKGLDILLIVLSVVGGVSVVGLAAMGVMHLTKGKEEKPSVKPAKKEEDDGDN